MSQINASSRCRIVGDFVDEAELPKGMVHSGAVMPTHVRAECIDVGAANEDTKEFTVVLQDGRVVSVSGHSLKVLPAAAAGESGSYGIVARTGGDEAIVALFKILDVVAIFQGDIRVDRKIA